ncbi:MAG: hypothetical protein U0Q16_23990 [Bryobacteraceae bacterium]
MTFLRILSTLALTATIALPQATRVIGAVTAIKDGELTVKTDAGQATRVTASPEVSVKKVAPSERDLSKAQVIAWSDIAEGDRVLVRGAGSADAIAATSIVVMTAREIQAKNETERQEWMRRSVAGVVERIDPAAHEIALSVRTAEGRKSLVVAPSAQASFRRYAPDSVRFADARPSTLDEVRKGDQLRALGDKTADGTRVQASQIVFGTFRTVAGAVTTANAEAGEIRIRDAATGKFIVIHTQPDTQLKRLPENLPQGRPPDLTAMADRLPSIKLDAIGAGESVIVLATAGAQEGQLTAITMLAGAEPILASLSRRTETGRAGNGPPQDGPSMGGMSGLEGMLGFPGLQ